MSKMLTVDPGFHTGLALWDDSNNPKTYSLNVSSPKWHKGPTLVIKGKVPIGVSDEEKLKDMWFKFKIFIHDYAQDLDLCIIEGVENWGGSLKSRTASVRGDLSKLAYLVGGYCSICLAHGIKFKIVSPRQWKGNLPNPALIIRIRHINGMTYPTEHVACAVGIGLAHRGLL